MLCGLNPDYRFEIRGIACTGDRAWELGLCSWAGELTAAGGEC